MLFVGIIDILQSYRFMKKMEHFWKSLVHDGDTISVHRPGFYAKRFQAFCFDKVFKKAEPPMPNSTETRKGTSFRRGNLRRTLSKDQETEVAQPPQSEPLRKVCKQKIFKSSLMRNLNVANRTIFNILFFNFRSQL